MTAPPASPESPPRNRGALQAGLRLVTWIFLSFVALIGVSVVALLFGVPVRILPLLMLGVVLAQVLMYVFYRVLRRLLWRVGRRLAFTYFLVGVLPIPMTGFLFLVFSYIVGGLFLGHEFRQALTAVQREVEDAGEITLARQGIPGSGTSVLSDVAFAFYEDDRWIGGDPRAPADWPDWLERDRIEASDPFGSTDRVPPVVALDEETLTVASASRDGPRGIVAFFDGHLVSKLRDLSGVWIDLMPLGEAREGGVNITVLGEGFGLAMPPVGSESDADRAEFLTRGGADPSFEINSRDVIPEILGFDDGVLVAADLPAHVAGTYSLVLGKLISSSPAVDTVAWLSFVIPAFLLFDVFAVAWIMAVLMILGISSAVNRLSRATAQVQSGDFSARIPVRRRDQIGALHTSFNQMAEGLETSVASLVKAESVEKELAVARDLQKSLIPNEIVQGADVEFATFFEPSAAIGGDYFDIFQLDQRRLAVMIADVSGHGLSAGLRMAMIKAALLILVEEHDDPRVILEQLDRVVRSSQEGHLFVTATLAFLDSESGKLSLTNAGHPPTYVVRRPRGLDDGGVEEVVLPGTPLGALGHNYGSRTLDLDPGDTVVWLSDGFIEATNHAGELFGYDRTRSSLEGESSTAAAVRDRLLDNVATHAAGEPAEDDRTLVVMRYAPTRVADIEQAAAVS